MQVKKSVSAGYRQLGDVFEILENSSLEPDSDFGADVTGCFRWFLSPQAVKLLNKKNPSSWLFLKHNTQFTISNQIWQGIDGFGVNIQLKI